jgi:hypothetical protein
MYKGALPVSVSRSQGTPMYNGALPVSVSLSHWIPMYDGALSACEKRKLFLVLLVKEKTFLACL